MQLHKLNPTFSPTVGSLTRMSNVGQLEWNWEDINILNKIIEGHLTYVTTKQLAVANVDMSAGGIIDQTDLSMLISWVTYVEPTEPVPGDITGDFETNVGDLVALIDYIIGGNVPQDMMEIADLNQNGEINIADVVTLVNLLLNEE